jgi:hypothetical protein
MKKEMEHKCRNLNHANQTEHPDCCPNPPEQAKKKRKREEGGNTVCPWVEAIQVMFGPQRGNLYCQLLEKEERVSAKWMLPQPNDAQTIIPDNSTLPFVREIETILKSASKQSAIHALKI